MAKRKGLTAKMELEVYGHYYREGSESPMLDYENENEDTVSVALENLLSMFEDRDVKITVTGMTDLDNGGFDDRLIRT